MRKRQTTGHYSCTLLQSLGWVGVESRGVGGWLAHLEASEVRDPRAADQVGDGLARVLDRPHELLEVLSVEDDLVALPWFRARAKAMGAAPKTTTSAGGRKAERGAGIAAYTLTCLYSYFVGSPWR